MNRLTHRRPVDAAIRALHAEGRVVSQLRDRLEVVDRRRFHLHRTMMRLRFVIDQVEWPVAELAELDEILADAGYASQMREVA